MVADVFQRQRDRLFGIAYRMLGSAADAEDVVQDAYLRWHEADQAVITNPEGWLTRVVTNLCLTRLTAARTKRETYVGPWLPEPVLTAGGALGPLDTTEQRESVSFALLATMERLTPAERAVFVLKEAFGYPHREIAALTGLTEANCRQLHRRARQRMRDRPRFSADPKLARDLLDRFLDAAAKGAMAELESLLAQDVVSTADGGGKATAARRPILGRAKVARYLTGTAWDRFPDLRYEHLEVNGQPAIIGRSGDTVLGLLLATESDGRLAAFHIVANPDKLAFLARQLSRSAALPGQEG
ncbi:RNA polymerase sigma-70 factor [Labedaea rhizosphaerae]|uniref:RNA polymerase ECF family sigma subunit n=1 Tax=Labedaea rhizosphaerae TaxID=598644 RepID=A0A4R6RQY2_LABRH|nr:RNA polymerase sigma-70 factor [Labedaea rhizosphaerae]TDP89211.1 RNA polymerase ECF family sigma subunit [Labedaea rhizosphaerae]